MSCQFEARVSDQSIDFEPSGADAAAETIIDPDRPPRHDHNSEAPT
jgi:hypothetical protein